MIVVVNPCDFFGFRAVGFRLPFHDYAIIISVHNAAKFAVFVEAQTYSVGIGQIRHGYAAFITVQQFLFLRKYVFISLPAPYVLQTQIIIPLRCTVFYTVAIRFLQFRQVFFQSFELCRRLRSVSFYFVYRVLHRIYALSQRIVRIYVPIDFLCYVARRHTGSTVQNLVLFARKLRFVYNILILFYLVRKSHHFVGSLLELFRAQHAHEFGRQFQPRHRHELAFYRPTVGFESQSSACVHRYFGIIHEYFFVFGVAVIINFVKPVSVPASVRINIFRVLRGNDIFGKFVADAAGIRTCFQGLVQVQFPILSAAAVFSAFFINMRNGKRQRPRQTEVVEAETRFTRTQPKSALDPACHVEIFGGGRYVFAYTRTHDYT